jgi:hypothetical protein
VGKRWTDTDDATILLFPAAEAAAILGRTVAAVHERRYRKGLTQHNRVRQPQKRLRREYFSTGQGPREEALPPQPPRKCRYCDGPHFTRGLCEPCYRWVVRMVKLGYVTKEMAEQLWLGAKL